MPALIATRLLSAVVIMLVLAAALFGLQQISRTDPVHTMLGPGASPAAIATERHVLGLDRPVASQLGHYLLGAVHGDLGTSYRTRAPVAADLRTYLPATLELALFALVLAVFLAVLLAVTTTLSWPGAGVLRFVLLLGGSTPAFFVAIGGLIVFYKYLGVLPATGSPWTRCCTGSSARSSTRCATCCCPASRWPSGRPSPSAGCCAPAW